MLSRTVLRASAFIFVLAVVCPGQQPTVVPAVPVTEQLKIRNLQFEQDKKIIESQRIEARYRELQAQIKADTDALDDLVREAADTAKVDLIVYVFDLDRLVFVPRNPQPLKPQTKEPKPDEKH